MATISASLVRELREKTGVGLMDCKKALSDANGDIEEALKNLREKGLSKASKKADRSANEGRVFITTTSGSAVILELNCETDFVASNNDFIEIGNQLAEGILNEASVNSIEDVDSLTINGTPFKTAISDAVLKLGENISVKEFKKVKASGSISEYIHMNGKIGVVVAFSGEVNADIGKDIAMQVAAAGPQYIKPEEVPTEEINKEKEILANQVRNEGKPEAIIDKIVQGKLSKYYKEVCLLEQAFIKDDKQSIKQILPSGVTVEAFVRYSLG